MQTPTRSTQIS